MFRGVGMASLKLYSSLLPKQKYGWRTGMPVVRLKHSYQVNLLLFWLTTLWPLYQEKRDREIMFSWLYPAAKYVHVHLWFRAIPKGFRTAGSLLAIFPPFLRAISNRPCNLPVKTDAKSQFLSAWAIFSLLAAEVYVASQNLKEGRFMALTTPRNY